MAVVACKYFRAGVDLWFPAGGSDSYRFGHEAKTVVDWCYAFLCTTATRVDIAEHEGGGYRLL